jgi:inner membrane protein
MIAIVYDWREDNIMGDNRNDIVGGHASGFWGRLFHSPAFKFVLIGIIVLLLMIPQLMVWGMVMEREGNASSVRAEVARSWGIEQNVKGPFLVIPFIEKSITISDGKPVEQLVERRAIFLPDDLQIKGKVKSKVLHRSIYDATVYNADLVISGSFGTPDFTKIAPNAVEIRWQDAIFSLALSSVSGLKETANLTINNSHKIAFEPSLGMPGANTMSGIHVRLLASDAKIEGPLPAFKFSTDLSFAGSQALRFAPAGRNTKVTLSSDWPHPSFEGAFLPKNRTISKEGFTANWQVPHLARSIPQSWVGNNFQVFNGYPGNAPGVNQRATYGKVKMMSSLSAGRSLDQFGRTMFGVKFYIPLDYYDLVNRALKYGLMFLVTAFAGVFVMELLSGRRVHGVQYLFVGMMMVFFYILLLSLSEHIGFFKAYLLSSVVTGGMLSLYVGKIHQSLKKGLIMLVLFLVIYGFLYMILRLEDYALLAGAVLGFVMLSATMFATLKVDWSGAGQQGDKS